MVSVTVAPPKNLKTWLDLVEIEVHTIAEFGRRQAARYTKSFERCFELLASQP